MSSVWLKIGGRLKMYAARYMKWRSTPSLCLWRTLFVNFYFLPFRQAKKLPIYVYGGLKITKFIGCMEIVCQSAEMSRGMIRLNAPSEAPGLGNGNTEIVLGHGKIIFEGHAFIGCGSKFLLWGGGELRIGNNAFISNGVMISCSKSICLGYNLRLGHQSQIMDTNFHYTYNTNKRTVRRNNSSVVLGHHCWIGSRSSIMKGVELPAYTTVASNSLVNSNITNKERTLIGGMPAKLLKDSFSRVFNFEQECKIAEFFSKNPSAEEYILTESLEQYD